MMKLERRNQIKVDLDGHSLTVEVLHHLVSRAMDKFPDKKLVVIGITWHVFYQKNEEGFILWYNVGSYTHTSTWATKITKR